MMNNEIMKRLTRNIKLNACFESIKECTNIASDYIEGIIEVNDVDELVVTLRSVEEDIDEINQIIMEMASEYESEIEELKYEQL